MQRYTSRVANEYNNLSDFSVFLLPFVSFEQQHCVPLVAAVRVYSCQLSCGFCGLTCGEVTLKDVPVVGVAGRGEMLFWAWAWA